MIVQVGSLISDYYLHENNRQAHQHTINSYLSKLKQIYLSIDLEFGDDKIFTDKLSEVLQTINDRWGNGLNRKTSYAGLILFAKALNMDDKIINEIINNMNCSVSKPTKKIIKQSDKPVIKFCEIKKNLDNGIKNIILDKKSIGRYQRMALTKYFIFNLYSIMPPIRNHYNSFKFLKDGQEENDGENYVDMKNNKFIFNQHNQIMKYSRIEVYFKDGIKELIEKFSPLIGDGNFLLTKMNIRTGINTPYKISHYSSLLKTIFQTGLKNLKKILLINNGLDIIDSIN